MKICRICKRELKEDNFYIIKKQGRYLQSDCKECQRKRNRLRNKTPKRKAYIYKWHKDNNYTQRPHIKKKRDTYWLVQQAIRQGKIIKPSLCSKCGIKEQVFAHHNNYDKPLEVEWLCINCHLIRHQELDTMKANLDKIWEGSYERP